MADNVAITAGSGTTIAADDIGAGVLVQRVKTTWGPDGTANDADVASGKPLPVQVRTATGLIPIGEPTDAKNTATDTTSVSGISIWKQISASVQAWVAIIANGGMTINSAQLGLLGQTVKGSSVPMVPASDWVYNTGKYVAVAAGQTAAVIQASAGAAGDYLDHVVVTPGNTAPGVVTILDNATPLISYPGGGTTALLTLTPFTIYVGAVSSSGAWKITTGANVTVLAVGRFS